MRYMLFMTVVAFASAMYFGMGWGKAFNLALSFFMFVVAAIFLLAKLFDLVYYLWTGEFPSDKIDDTEK